MDKWDYRKWSNSWFFLSLISVPFRNSIGWSSTTVNRTPFLGQSSWDALLGPTRMINDKRWRYFLRRIPPTGSMWIIIPLPPVRATMTLSQIARAEYIQCSHSRSLTCNSIIRIGPFAIVRVVMGYTDIFNFISCSKYTVWKKIFSLCQI